VDCRYWRSRNNTIRRDGVCLDGEKEPEPVFLETNAYLGKDH
jgi:hypothetical protein